VRIQPKWRREGRRLSNKMSHNKVEAKMWVVLHRKYKWTQNLYSYWTLYKNTIEENGFYGIAIQRIFN
jgi:hypothetical protein